VALLLAAVGTFGVISYNVARRSREIGLRMALGAQPGAVLRMIVRGSLLLAGVGLAAGVLASLALSRVIAGLLYGVPAADPVTFAAVALIMAATATAAAWLPAHRAARLDPASALRAE
jgi:putative ABC transport system permease protein